MLEKFKNSYFYRCWRRLLDDLKPMTWPERLEHLWNYYKEYLWIGLFVVIFVVIIVSGLVRKNTEVLASGMLVNIAIDQKGYNYLSTDYLAALGGEKGKQTVELDYTNFSSLADPTSSEDNYTKANILLARVSGRMLDYIILDEFAVRFYAGEEVYLDLREVFSEEELAELDVFYAQEEGEERIPVAIRITELPFVKDNITTEGHIYFALSGSTPRPEACRDVWNYLHAWKPDSAETQPAA